MAVTMNPEELAALVGRAVQTALASAPQRADGGGSGGGSSGGGRRVLDLKTFSNVAPFTGSDGEWVEWSFGFGITLNASHAGIGKLVANVLKSKEEMTAGKLEFSQDEEFNTVGMGDVEKLGKELFEVLAINC